DDGEGGQARGRDAHLLQEVRQARGRYADHAAGGADAVIQIRRRRASVSRPSSASAPSAPMPSPIALTLVGVFAGAGVGATGADFFGGGGDDAFHTLISGMSRVSTDASCSLPRGANAIFAATCVCGGPQMPRRGFAHAIGPVHGWRIA